MTRRHDGEFVKKKKETRNSSGLNGWLYGFLYPPSAGLTFHTINLEKIYCIYNETEVIDFCLSYYFENILF